MICAEIPSHSCGYKVTSYSCGCLGDTESNSAAICWTSWGVLHEVYFDFCCPWQYFAGRAGTNYMKFILISAAPDCIVSICQWSCHWATNLASRILTDIWFSLCLHTWREIIAVRGKPIVVVEASSAIVMHWGELPWCVSEIDHNGERELDRRLVLSSRQGSNACCAHHHPSAATPHTMFIPT